MVGGDSKVWTPKKGLWGIEESLASEMRFERCVASFLENHFKQEIPETFPLTQSTG